MVKIYTTFQHVVNHISNISNARNVIFAQPARTYIGLPGFNGSFKLSYRFFFFDT